MAKPIGRTQANQLAFSARVRAVMQVSGEQIAEKAAEVLFKKRKKKRRLDLVAVTQDILELLNEAEAELEATSEAHADELADDDPLREERDDAKLDLSSGMLSTKSILTGAFGARFVKRVGLDRPLEERPDLVSKVAAGAVRLLRKVKKPASSFAGAKLDLNDLADELDAKVKRVNGLLSALKREEREAQQTMIARDQATEHWANVITLAAGWMEGLARIAGEHKIADNVRPTEHRRNGIPEEQETEVETDDTDVEADTDTDVGPTDTDAG